MICAFSDCAAHSKPKRDFGATHRSGCMTVSPRQALRQGLGEEVDWPNPFTARVMRSRFMADGHVRESEPASVPEREMSH